MEQNRQLIKLDIPTPTKVYKLSGYRWNKESNKKEAFCYYVPYLEKVVRGELEEAEKYKEEIKDIFSLDLSQNCVTLARSQGIAAKIFGVSEESKPVLKFRGKDFNWVLKDIGISSHPVPARFKNIVQEINKAGILFDDFYVGEPEVQQLPAPQARRKRDPILVARIGRWLIELGRWI